MAKTLLCTVGTSLKTNLIQHSEEYKSFYEQAGKKGLPALKKKLISISPEERLLGAEINSIASLMKKKFITHPERIVLLISDTPDAEKISELLKSCLESNCDLFADKKTEIIICRNEGLKDDNVESFKRIGLRNLVKNISSYVQKFGKENVIINATGGYKAQILYAGIIGQALGIPLYYKHELFDEIIELPPQPVSLDMGFWLRHSDIFFMLDMENTVPEDELSGFIKEPESEYLVNRVSIDNIDYFELSPTGQIFHEGFKVRFPVNAGNFLPPANDATAKNKKFTQEPGAPPDRPPGLSRFIQEKIFSKGYVQRAHSYYYNPDLPRKCVFRKAPKGEPDQIELVYSDGKATGKVSIYTTARTREQNQAAIADLNLIF